MLGFGGCGVSEAQGGWRGGSTAELWAAEWCVNGWLSGRVGWGGCVGAVQGAGGQAGGSAWLCRLLAVVGVRALCRLGAEGGLFGLCAPCSRLSPP